MNMICFCPETYYVDKDKEILSESNDYYGFPFPANGGARLFQSCFCPAKATVLGISAVSGADSCNYKGKWYLFHHDCVPSGGKTWLRSLKVIELEYDREGAIKTIGGKDL
jgi:hypothetical protein